MKTVEDRAARRRAQVVPRPATTLARWWYPSRVLGEIAIALALGPAAAASVPSFTCDPARIERRSLALTTDVQAQIIKRTPVEWQAFFEPESPQARVARLGGLTSLTAAQRALELDPKNLMGYGLEARELLTTEDGAGADQFTGKALLGGGAVAWTATLYDVDVRSYFLMAFDRQAIRIYRFGQLVTPLQTHGGIPEFPGPEARGFWEAWGGCPDAAVVPEARIAWSEVKEIRAGNWVLWFKLAHPIEVASDRGQRKKLDEIKVNLHGAAGTTETYQPPESDDAVDLARGPWSYYQLVRSTLVKYVDPDGRIALPASKPGHGW
jgi:hypothetical protein